MAEAYIVDALRTPVGRRGGGLGGIHPADLGAHVIREIVGRNDIDPLAVEDVHATIFTAMGISPRQAYDIEGRPFYATVDGKGKAAPIFA